MGEMGYSPELGLCGCEQQVECGTVGVDSLHQGLGLRALSGTRGFVSGRERDVSVYPFHFRVFEQRRAGVISLDLAFLLISGGRGVKV